MPQGLPRKLRYAFILQALLAGVVIVAGTWATGRVLGDVLAGQLLRAEADGYWMARSADPGYPVPSSATVHGYFVAAGLPADQVPARLAALEPGVHELPAQGQKVLVEEHTPGRLYLLMSFDALQDMIRWVCATSMLLALLVVLATTWFTYRRTRRMVAPVSLLAQQVSHWDPRAPNLAAIAPERLPGGGREVWQLSGALRDLAARTHDFVQRERDFTRDASHELRTPLTIIRVATDMMLTDPQIPARMHQVLLRMQHAGRDMEAVIDAFLILAREGGVEPLQEDFDVDEVVGEEVEKVRPLLADKPVRLDVVASASPRLHASPRVLAVMLGQLLDNACTFTEHGRIEVRIEADRVVIGDTGIGMDSETMQKAYDPFYRADPVNATGKGMGLSIVRRLGERFGWPVTLESVPGVGTTVTIGFAAHLIP